MMAWEASATSQDTVVLSPAKGGGRWLAIMAFFILLAVGSVAVLLSEDHIKPFELLFFFVGLVMFSGFALLSWFQYRASRTSYALDAGKIRRIGHGAKTVQWSEVADLDFRHPLGGAGELTVTLRDARGGKLLAIPTELLGRGARTLIDQLQIHLRPIYERHTREYLSDQVSWDFPFIKRMLQIRERVLMVEFPKGKRLTIPFEHIQKVEWLPGPISGAKRGHVLIEYIGGQIEIPQQAKGIQYFVFALKYLYGFGDRVNPLLTAEMTTRLDKGRKSQASARLLTTAGLVLILMPGYHFLKNIGPVLDDQTTRQMGFTATATITDKNPDNQILITYTDASGQKQILPVNVRPSFFNSVTVGQPLSVKHHPSMPRTVWFDGIARLPPDKAWILFGMIFVFMIAGVGLIIYGQMRVKRIEREIKNLEPAPAASFFSVPAVPLPPGQSHVMPAMGPSGPLPQPLSASNCGGEPTSVEQGSYCSQCETSILGAHYLSEGVVWCSACKDKGGIAAPKPRFPTLLLAGSVGTGFAFIGGAIWATAAILTGYELGIIAILVGLIVGYGVKLGAGRHQGRSLQVLALVLTFYAMGYSMIPIAIHQIMNDPKQKQQIIDAFENGLKQSQGNYVVQGADLDLIASEVEDDSTTLAQLLRERAVEERIANQTGTTSPTTALVDDQENDGTTDSLTESEEFGVMESLAPPPPDQTMLGGEESLNDVSAPEILLALLLIVLLVLLAPFVICLVITLESPIWVLFLGIALWEAWRLNRPVQRTFEGPFTPHQPTLNFNKADFGPQ